MAGATRKEHVPKFTKNTYLHPSRQPSLMGPSFVSIVEDSDDSSAFSFVDGYLTHLPAGMFDLKP